MTRIVLDASALLAVLLQERGAEVVERRVSGAALSTVNYSEVLKKAVEKGGTLEGAASVVRSLQMEIIPFEEWNARDAARLYPTTKDKGLSFADRECLSLAMDLDAPTLHGRQAAGWRRRSDRRHLDSRVPSRPARKSGSSKDQQYVCPDMSRRLSCRRTGGRLIRQSVLLRGGKEYPMPVATLLGRGPLGPSRPSCSQCHVVVWFPF